MGIRNDPLRLVYNGWERFLNDASKLVGVDRELDRLSQKLTTLKGEAYSDLELTPQELDAIYDKMELITKAYVQLATQRGLPPGEMLPSTKEGFKIYAESQQIHFEALAGKELDRGLLGQLIEAMNDYDFDAVKTLQKKVAFDLIASASEPIATDKVRLIRAQLSLVDDRSRQLDVIAGIRANLEAELKGSLFTGAKHSPISLVAFDKASRFSSVGSIQDTPLPGSVKGTNKMFPNHPIPGWEAVTRKAVKAGLDDLEKAGRLFLATIPSHPAGSLDRAPKTVAMKLDLNFGAEGPPSVSDPTATAATLLELLERAEKGGKAITFTVGDSAGGENIPLGRTTMDIMRNTGNYHYALKAGLQFAVSQGDSAAKEPLAKLVAREDAGVFFGSKDDLGSKDGKASTLADLAQAEAAAGRYVRCVDYDDEGFVSIDPGLGPMGLAAWGTKEFQIAKPWVEADYRVHVSRSASHHVLARWTGPTKGLIGLHAFGLRPTDQGMDKRGDSIIDTFPLLTQIGGFMAIFENRTGFKDLVERAKTSGDHGLEADLEAVTMRWKELMANTKVWKSFSEQAHALTAELKQDKKSGMADPELMDKMRRRTRAILDAADAQVPGFREGMWDAMAKGTAFGMKAAWNFRLLIPSQMKDEQTGARIGLLTSLPHPSDLVVTSQAKVGEGGGADAYKDVKDVGKLIVATDEPTADALAWHAGERPDNMYRENYGVQAALRFGRGPMHLSEINFGGEPGGE